MTGRNILMNKMRMFGTRMGVNIDPYIYIENKIIEELMKEKFSAGNLVPRFKDLKRGSSILRYVPQIERVTDKSKRRDKAAGLFK